MRPLALVAVALSAGCSSLPTVTDVDLTPTGLSAEFPDPADIARAATEQARIAAESEQTIARECYRTLQIGKRGDFLCPGMTRPQDVVPETPDYGAIPSLGDDGTTTSGAVPLAERLAAREGGPLLEERDGHICHGHHVTDEERTDGRFDVPITPALCDALLAEDVDEARTEALAAFDVADDAHVELCFWRPCRRLFGAEADPCARALAVANDAHMLRTDRGRTLRIARAIARTGNCR